MSERIETPEVAVPVESPETGSPDARADWSVPLPAEIPRSAYMPAVMAFGVTFFLWGFVSSPVVLAIGFAVTVVALVGWIGEMRDGA